MSKKNFANENVYTLIRSLRKYMAILQIRVNNNKTDYRSFCLNQRAKSEVLRIHQILNLYATSTQKKITQEDMDSFFSVGGLTDEEIAQWEKGVAITEHDEFQGTIPKMIPRRDVE